MYYPIATLVVNRDRRDCDATSSSWADYSREGEMVVGSMATCLLCSSTG